MDNKIGSAKMHEDWIMVRSGVDMQGA